MSLMGTLNRMTGNIRVVEKDNIVTVYGVSSDAIERGIKNLWNTSRITSNMFISMNWGSFSFPSFFATEVVYALDKMTADNSTTISVRGLNAIKHAIIENTWLFKTNREAPERLDFSKLDKMTLTPLPFQMDFLRKYSQTVTQYNLNGLILNGAPGSGKTFTGLALAECLSAERIIVVCPPNALHRVWESSIQSLYKRQQTYWIARDGKPYNNERILVVHYEALGKIQNLIHEFKAYKTAVILDESHNLNEITSMRTDLFISFCKGIACKDVIYASGTPVKAMGNELRPILRVLDPLFTEDVEERYRKIYGKDATKALDILQHRFGLISFRIEKKELKLQEPVISKVKVKSKNGHLYTLSAIRTVMSAFITERMAYYQTRANDDLDYFTKCLDIHERTLKNREQYAEYRVSLERVIRMAKKGAFRVILEEMKACNAYEKKHILPSLPPEMKAKFSEVKTLVKYPALKVQGECLGRVLGRMRIDCHVDMVKYVDFNALVNSTDKKTLVFTSFVDVLEETKRATEKLGFKPLVVYGKTNSELGKIIHEFETNVDIDPLIATFNSLSTAVPLVMADTLVMMNAPFRAYMQDQAISRIHRIGADTQTYVYMVELDTDGEVNISSRSTDILAWSQQQVAAIVGGDIPFDITELGDNGNVTISTEGYVLESFTLDPEPTKLPVYSNW